MKITEWWKKYNLPGKDLLYDPQAPENPLWEKLANAAGGSGLELEGIHSGAHQPARNSIDPYEADLENQLEIQRKRSTGFNQRIIVPAQLSATADACQLPIAFLTALFGYDGENAGYGNPAVIRNAWRTVVIPVSGNFLKIDWAVNKINGISRAISTNLDTANINKDNWPAFGLGTVPSGMADPSGSIDINQTTNFPKVYEANPNILVQFETNNSPPLIGTIGANYRTPFSQIILTFKSGCPPFIVTWGFNSVIETPYDNRLINANPAFGPGNALWTNPLRHCVPFAWQNDIYTANTPPSLGTLGSVADSSLAANAVTNFSIFKVPLTGSFQDQAGVSHNINMRGGMAVGWLTSFSLAGIAQPSAGGGNWFHAYLYVAGAGARQRLIYGNEVFGTNTAAAGPYCALNPVSISFAHPIRFDLRPGDQMFLCMRNSSSTAVYPIVSFTGYIYGNVMQEAIVTASDTGWIPELTTEASFPLDIARPMFGQ